MHDAENDFNDREIVRKWVVFVVGPVVDVIPVLSLSQPFHVES